MPRRNNRAGQPNREAQKNRRAFRLQVNTAFKPVPKAPVPTTKESK